MERTEADSLSAILNGYDVRILLNERGWNFDELVCKAIKEVTWTQPTTTSKTSV
jgi:hypothetical protein